MRRKFDRTIASVLATVMAFEPALAVAQSRIVVDPGSSTTVDQAANGVPLVNIARPSGAGVSHNQFRDFNVGPDGLILNNATKATSTQLGGIVYGNEQLGGRAARIILNEVTGVDDSRLEGFSEIAGGRAEFVLANPNGVTCAGCGFINTSRVTLSTGRPVMELGAIKDLLVEDGTVAFEGAGGNFRGVPVLDVVSRKVRIDGPIHGETVNVVAGRNAYDYAGGTARPLAPGGAGARPEAAIDSSALGGMYADRIALIANEKGVGVRLAGELAANAGELDITADGQLVLRGRAVASGDVGIRAAGLANDGSVEAGGHAAVEILGDVANRGRLAAADGLDLALDGRLENAGEIVATGGGLTVRGATSGGAAAVDNQGRVGAVAGAVRVETGALANAGEMVSGRDLVVDVAGAALNSGRLAAADGALDLAAGSLVNDGAVAANGPVTLRIAADAINRGLVFAGGGLDIGLAGTLDNAGGEIASASADLVIAGLAPGHSAAGLRNDGRIEATLGNLLVQAGEAENAGDIVAGGGLALTGLREFVQMGRLYAEGGLRLGVDGRLENTGTMVAAEGDLAIGGNAAGRTATIVNDGGIAARTGDLAISAEALTSTGELVAGGSVGLDLTGLAANTGRIAALDGTLDLAAAELRNDGDMAAGDALRLAVGGDVRNGGLLFARDALRLGAAGAITNAGGEIVAADGALIVEGLTSGTAAGALVNQGGRIEATGGDLYARAARFDSDGVVMAGGSLAIEGVQDFIQTGRLYAAGDLRLGIDGRLENSGTIASAAGDLTVAGNAPGRHPAAVENGGVMEATAGELRLTAGALANPGELVAGGAVRLAVDGLTANEGRIAAISGALDLDTGRIANGGTLAAGGVLTLDAAGDAANQGLVYAREEVRLGVAGALANGGRIVSAGSVEVAGRYGAALGALRNAGGRIEATDGDLVVRTVAADGEGALAAGGGLALTVANDLVHQGELYAGGDLRLTVDGRLENAGSIVADAGVVLEGVVVVNDGAVSAGDGLDARAAGDLTNRGSLLAGEGLGLVAGGRLTNAADAGIVSAAADVALQAAALINDGGVAAARGLSAVISGSAVNRGLLLGGQDLRLGVGGTLDNVKGAILADAGDLVIEGTTSGSAAAAVNNRSGLIEATSGDVTIRAGALRNTIDGGVVQRTVRVFDEKYYFQDYAIDELPDWNDAPGYQAHEGGATYWRRESSAHVIVPDPYLGYDYATYWTSAYGGAEGSYVHVYADEVQFETSGAQALISAGRNLTIAAGTIVNDASHITARGDMTLTGGSLENKGYASYRQFYTDCRHWESCRSFGGRGAAWSIRPQRMSPGPLLSEPNPWFQVEGDRLAGTIQAGGALRGSFQGQIDNKTIIAHAALDTLPGYSGTLPQVLTPDPGAGRVDGIGADDLLTPGATDRPAGADIGGGLFDAVPGDRPAGPSVGDVLAGIPGGEALFVPNPAPNARYVIETRHKFATFEGFYGSDYLLDRLEVDPDELPPFLGDAYFDSRHVLRQVLDETGQRYLDPAYVDDRAQMKGLLDNAAEVAGDLDLQLGVALTPEQVAALDRDIVWYVRTTVGGQEVLEPRLYLAEAGRAEVAFEGATISGGTVALAGERLTNSGTIEGEAALALATQGDLSNVGGEISSGGDMALSAGGSVHNVSVQRQWQTRGGHQSQLDQQGRIDAAGDLTITAGADVTGFGSVFEAGGDVSLDAGGDLVLAAVGVSAYDEWRSGKSWTLLDRLDHIGTSLTAGGGMTLRSGGDTTLNATDVTAGDDLTVAADGQLSIASAIDAHHSAARHQSRGFLSSRSSFEETERFTHRGSNLASTGGSVTLSGGDGIDLLASRVSAAEDIRLRAGMRLDADTGEYVAVNPDADIRIAGAADLERSRREEKRSGLFVGSGGGFLSFYGAEESSAAGWQESNVGSMLTAGGDLEVEATRDVLVQGSDLTAGGDAEVVAGRDLVLAAGREAEEQTERHSSSGFGFGFSGGSGGFGVSVGLRKAESGRDFAGRYTAGTGVSAGGDLALIAGRDATLAGATVAAGGAATIAGRDVSLLSEVDRETLSGFEREMFVGITAEIGQNVTGAAEAVAGLPQAVGAAEGGAGATLITAAGESLRVIDAVRSATSAPAGASIGFGVSGWESSWSSTGETVVPTTVTASDVTLTADRDLQLTGAQVGAWGDVLLSGETIRLEAAEARNASSASSRSFDASVGYSWSVGPDLGVTAGWSASVAGSQSASSASGTNLLNTHVSGDSVIVASSGDTTLEGAVVAGDQVRAAVGGDLHVESVPETGRSASSSESFNLSAGGTGGSVGGSAGRASGDRSWISEQSGFIGNDVAVDVEGDTTLVGGIIGGDLETGTLTYRDVAGHERSRDVLVGGSVGTGTRPDGQDSSVTAEGRYKSIDREQVARATVTGDVTVTRPEDQAQDLVALNRDSDRALEVTRDERTSFSGYVSDTAVGEAASGFAGIRRNLEQWAATLGLNQAEVRPIVDGYERVVDALVQDGGLTPEQAAEELRKNEQLRDQAAALGLADSLPEDLTPEQRDHAMAHIVAGIPAVRDPETGAVVRDEAGNVVFHWGLVTVEPLPPLPGEGPSSLDPELLAQTPLVQVADFLNDAATVVVDLDQKYGAAARIAIEGLMLAATGPVKWSAEKAVELAIGDQVDQLIDAGVEWATDQGAKQIQDFYKDRYGYELDRDRAVTLAAAGLFGTTVLLGAKQMIDTAKDLVSKGLLGRKSVSPGPVSNREIKLVNGFYQVDGLPFKFKEYYYDRLWSTGTGAPFLQAQEVLDTATAVTPDRMPGFYRYENGSMEMIYNPTTQEVWHLRPL